MQCCDAKGRLLEGMTDSASRRCCKGEGGGTAEVSGASGGGCRCYKKQATVLPAVVSGNCKERCGAKVDHGCCQRRAPQLQNLATGVSYEGIFCDYHFLFCIIGRRMLQLLFFSFAL